MTDTPSREQVKEALEDISNGFAEGGMQNEDVDPHVRVVLAAARAWLEEPTEPLVDCIYCQGSGKVPEQHAPWATEWLGCQDCRGKGKIPKSWLGPQVDEAMIERAAHTLMVESWQHEGADIYIAERVLRAALEVTDVE